MKSFNLYTVIMEHSKRDNKNNILMKQFKLQQLTDNILKHVQMKEIILKIIVVWGFLTILYSAHETSGASQESRFASSFSSVGLNILQALIN